MTAATRWRRLEALFEQALRLPGDGREAFARAEAADDPALLHELLAMLAVAGDATDRLAGPLRSAVQALRQAREPELPAGTRFGAWAIDRIVGAGGMGQVYLGHRADGAYERRVAIKLFSRCALDSRAQVLFEHECRVLAQMQHPAIAQIHDAGTDPGGRPFLVMEYIQGQPITAWCDEFAMSMRDRVALLVTACEGVQHAHQKGVIHRDLKPGNVLVGQVDGRAMPKIIDFGIAVDATQAPGAVARGGTPGYMSPEQGTGRVEADARSDVYSLGALLYELACGERPADAADAVDGGGPARHLRGLAPTARKARATARGTTARGLLRELDDGLDAIARKAMRPDPADRYASVTSLVDDLLRWLGHHPPRAMPRDRLLALRKLVRRQRLPVAAMAAVALSLVAGLVAVSWSLERARQEAERAQVTAEFLGALLRGVDPAVARDLDTTLLLRILDDAANRASVELAARPDVLAEVELTIAVSMIGLNEHARAIAHLQTVRDHVAGRDALARYDLRAMQLLGQAMDAAGRPADAEAVLREAIALSERLDGPDTLLRHDLQSRRAWALRSLGRRDEALEAGRDAYAGFVRLQPPDGSQRIEAGARHAINLSDAGRHDEAIALMREMIALRTAQVGADHPFTLSMRNSLGVFLRRNGDHAAAEAEYRSQLAPVARLHGERSTNALMVHFNLATVLRALDRQAEAGRHFRIARDGFVAALGDTHLHSTTAREGMNRWLAENGRAGGLLPAQRELAATVLDVHGDTHPHAAHVLLTLALVELEHGLAAEARANVQRALAIFGDEGAGAERARALLARIEAASTGS